MFFSTCLSFSLTDCRSNMVHSNIRICHVKILFWKWKTILIHVLFRIQEIIRIFWPMFFSMKREKNIELNKKVDLRRKMLNLRFVHFPRISNRFARKWKWLLFWKRKKGSNLSIVCGVKPICRICFEIHSIVSFHSKGKVSRVDLHRCFVRDYCIRRRFRSLGIAIDLC